MWINLIVGIVVGVVGFLLVQAIQRHRRESLCKIKTTYARGTLIHQTKSRSSTIATPNGSPGDRYGVSHASPNIDDKTQTNVAASFGSTTPLRERRFSQSRLLDVNYISPDSIYGYKSSVNKKDKVPATREFKVKLSRFPATAINNTINRVQSESILGDLSPSMTPFGSERTSQIQRNLSMNLNGNFASVDEQASPIHAFSSFNRSLKRPMFTNGDHDDEDDDDRVKKSRNIIEDDDDYFEDQDDREAMDFVSVSTSNRAGKRTTAAMLDNSNNDHTTPKKRIKNNEIISSYSSQLASNSHKRKYSPDYSLPGDIETDFSISKTKKRSHIEELELMTENMNPTRNIYSVVADTESASVVSEIDVDQTSDDVVLIEKPNEDGEEEKTPDESKSEKDPPQIVSDLKETEEVSLYPIPSYIYSVKDHEYDKKKAKNRLEKFMAAVQQANKDSEDNVENQTEVKSGEKQDTMVKLIPSPSTAFQIAKPVAETGMVPPAQVDLTKITTTIVPSNEISNNKSISESESKFEFNSKPQSVPIAPTVTQEKSGLQVPKTTVSINVAATTITTSNSVESMFKAPVVPSSLSSSLSSSFQVKLTDTSSVTTTNTVPNINFGTSTSTSATSTPSINIQETKKTDIPKTLPEVPILTAATTVAASVPNFKFDVATTKAKENPASCLSFLLNQKTDPDPKKGIGFSLQNSQTSPITTTATMGPGLFSGIPVLSNSATTINNAGNQTKPTTNEFQVPSLVPTTAPSIFSFGTANSSSFSKVGSSTSTTTSGGNAPENKSPVNGGLTLSTQKPNDPGLFPTTTAATFTGINSLQKSDKFNFGPSNNSTGSAATNTSSALPSFSFLTTPTTGQQSSGSLFNFGTNSQGVSKPFSFGGAAPPTTATQVATAAISTPAFNFSSTTPSASKIVTFNTEQKQSNISTPVATSSLFSTPSTKAPGGGSGYDFSAAASTLGTTSAGGFNFSATPNNNNNSISFGTPSSAFSFNATSPTPVSNNNNNLPTQPGSTTTPFTFGTPSNFGTNGFQFYGNNK